MRLREKTLSEKYPSNCPEQNGMSKDSRFRATWNSCSPLTTPSGNGTSHSLDLETGMDCGGEVSNSVFLEAPFTPAFDKVDAVPPPAPKHKRRLSRHAKECRTKWIESRQKVKRMESRGSILSDTSHLDYPAVDDMKGITSLEGEITSEDDTSDADCEQRAMDEMTSPTCSNERRGSSRPDTDSTFWNDEQYLDEMIGTLTAGSNVNKSVTAAILLEEIQNANASQNDSGIACSFDLEKKKLATYLHISCLKGFDKCVQHLLNYGLNADIKDANGRTGLHFAAKGGHATCVSLLLERGANANCWDSKKQITPLQCAALSGSTECIKIILKHGADVNSGLDGKEGKSALYYVAQNGFVDSLQILLEAGANPNSTTAYSETPLHVACAESHSDCVQLLLKYDADIRVLRGTSRNTPLHLAADEGSAECVRLLIDHGANVHSLNAWRKTPLHLAALAQSSEAVDILLRSGANPNTPDSDGRVALHGAISKGARSLDVIKLLVYHAANANCRDAYGYTPLHVAALNEFSIAATLLLQHGADVTARTNGGVSALAFIMRRIPEILPKFIARLDGGVALHEHDINDLDCELKFNFRLLVPYNHRGESRLFMTLIKEGQRHLLKHPLCEAFLHLKWLKTRKFFWISLLFYGFFTGMFTMYVMSVFLHDCTNSEFEDPNITHDKTTYRIPYERRHPKPVTTEIPPTEPPLNDNDTDLSRMGYSYPIPGITECEIPPFAVTIWAILIATTGLLIMKEIFQIVHSIRKYIRSYENCIQWTIIICVILVAWKPPHIGAAHEVPLWHNHVAAIAIFLTWTELMMLVGRFPQFGLYIQMFATVSKNIGKMLLVYSCLIIAFGLSFGVLFPNYLPFHGIIDGIIKTLVMMAGELEFENIFFNDNGDTLYPVTAHLIFVAFLLLVTIVLMNLLVGLAVSDIQGLQKSAGLNRLVRQAELIDHIESMVFSRLLHCLPERFICALHTNALLVPSAYHWAMYVRPNDPRDTRLPREVVDAALKMVTARYTERHKRELGNSKSQTSCLTSTFISTGDYSTSKDIPVSPTSKDFSESKDSMSLLSNRLDEVNEMKNQLISLVSERQSRSACLTEVTERLKSGEAKLAGIKEQLVGMQISVTQLRALVEEMIHCPNEHTP